MPAKDNAAPPKEPVADQLLYPVPLAARVLGLSARLLWDFIAHGKIKTRRVGTRVLIHRRELEKFAAHDHETVSESAEAST
jgi:excisionase family DNA binding protein